MQLVGGPRGRFALLLFWPRGREKLPARKIGYKWVYKPAQNDQLFKGIFGTGSFIRFEVLTNCWCKFVKCLFICLCKIIFSCSIENCIEINHWDEWIYLIHISRKALPWRMIAIRRNYNHDSLFKLNNVS